jgi:hypothetical protein
MSAATAACRWLPILLMTPLWPSDAGDDDGAAHWASETSKHADKRMQWD